MHNKISLSANIYIIYDLKNATFYRFKNTLIPRFTRYFLCAIFYMVNNLSVNIFFPEPLLSHIIVFMQIYEINTTYIVFVQHTWLFSYIFFFTGRLFTRFSVKTHHKMNAPYKSRGKCTYIVVHYDLKYICEILFFRELLLHLVFVIRAAFSPLKLACKFGDISWIRLSCLYLWAIRRWRQPTTSARI